MRYSQAVTLAVVLLSGCQSLEQVAEQRAKKIEPQMLAYIECGMTEARGLSPSDNDPYAIAITVQSICAKERLNLHKSIERTYDAAIWSRLKASFDQSFLESAIARVVKDRAAR